MKGNFWKFYFCYPISCSKIVPFGELMKKVGSILLKRYSEMSGDKKVRLGLRLSEMVRQVRKEGKVATGA